MNTEAFWDPNIKMGFGGPKTVDPKICIIINKQFCYLLKVDGNEIAFQGEEAANYFAEHYHKLGYEVVRKDERERYA